MTRAPTFSHDAAHLPKRRVRLLIADDSFVARQSIVTYLRTLEDVDLYAVCDNGRAAVEAALRSEPDVVLLDLQMPVMSGLEAAEIFRNSMPHVGVIMTSVHDHEEVRHICLSGGADAFIGKGSISSQFPAVLAQVLELTNTPARHRRANRYPTASARGFFPPPPTGARAHASGTRSPDSKQGIPPPTRGI